MRSLVWERESPYATAMMITSWHGDVFCVTDPLWGESTGQQMLTGRFPSQRGIGTIRQQAIIWTNNDPDLYRHMATLGHNMLFNQCWWNWEPLSHYLNVVGRNLMIIISAASTKLKGGYTGFTSPVRLSVGPSVCGQNRVRSVSSTILVGSISYLHILSSNFRMCITYHV